MRVVNIRAKWSSNWICINLHFALHFLPVAVQFNCLVLNKSVLGKTSLMILSTDISLSSADCTHNCRHLKCESEIKVVRMQNFSQLSWLCTEYRLVCLMNKDCLNCVKTLGGIWALDSWALFIVHPLLKYVLYLDLARSWVLNFKNENALYRLHLPSLY